MRVLSLLVALTCISSVVSQQLIEVGNYVDSSCSTLNPSDPALATSDNGACLVNPLNNNQATIVTCNPDNTWSFNAYLNGACTGPAIFTQSNLANKYCLNVIGNYISVICNPDTASNTTANSTSSSGGALNALLNSNGTMYSNSTVLLITVPVYELGQYDSTYIQDRIVNTTNTTVYSITGSLTLDINSTNTTNIIAELQSLNVTTKLFTDLTNVTTVNSTDLLIDAIPQFSFNSTKVNVSSVYLMFNHISSFGIYNSTVLVNDSILLHALDELFNETSLANVSLTTIVAYVPIYNESEPLQYDIISTHNLTSLSFNTTNTTDIYTELVSFIVA